MTLIEILTAISLFCPHDALASTTLYVKDATGFHELTDTEAARRLEPERFARFACAKLVESYKNFILKAVSEGEKVHCEMNGYGPVIFYEHTGGESTIGCPDAVYENKIEKCTAIHIKVPKWAKEKK